MPILIPPKDADAEAAGKKLAYLSQHAQDAGDPEIVKFRGNPNSYLNDLGYRKWTGVDDGDGNPQTQPIPANIKIITLFEDENTLYSVIPWSGDLPADMSKQPPPEPEWWSFYSALARYFMRHCR